MSLVNLISRIEEERALNQTLLQSLLERLDADIKRIQETKTSLMEEFNERDASLLRIIDGEPVRPAAAIPASEPVTEKPDAELAA